MTIIYPTNSFLSILESLVRVGPGTFLERPLAFSDPVIWLLWNPSLMEGT